MTDVSRNGPCAQDINRGIALIVTGLLIIPAIDAIAKFLSDSVPVLQITWARFLFQSILMAGAVLLHNSASALLPKRPVVQLIRGLLLAMATLIFFWSLKYLPIADAIAIFFIQPLILTLFSALFLGEQVGWHRRIAVVAGFIGALVIIQPGSSTFQLAAVLPVLTAIFFAGYMTLTRATAGHDTAETAQFAAGMGALVVLSVCLFAGSLTSIESLQPVMPDLAEWGWLALLGVIAAFCHLLMVKAMELAPASVLAPFAYTEFIGATLLGWLIFDDIPSNNTWLGAVIIIASGLYVYLRERRLNAATAPEPM